MASITKDDIAGSRITKIHSSYEDMDGCDCTTVYFTTDRGLVFTMPYPGYRWEATEIPPDAEELPDQYEENSYAVRKHFFFWRKFVRQDSRTIDLIRRMKQRSILGVFCPKMDEDLGFYEPDEAFLRFDDGSRAYCTTVAPHGTGASGLHYITNPEEIEDEDLVDFFVVPLVDEEPKDEDGHNKTLDSKT